MNSHFRFKKLHLALVAGATAIFAAAPAAQAAIVTATPNLSITNTIDGIYINLVTGVTGATGSAVTGWDLNPYNNNAGLTFYGAASPSGVLATGIAGSTAVASSLTVGSVVSPTPAVGFYNQFQTVGTAFQVTGTEYLGFKFLNEATGAYNYGFAQFSTAAGTGTNLGFPTTLVRYAYENTGLAITVTAVPEPSTFALFGVALAGAAGLRVLRRRKA